MKKEVINIHNNFFLQLLSNKQNAIDFLKISLSNQITKELFSETKEEASMVTFLDAIKIEGKIEGKIEEKQKTLIRQLSKKFGVITEDEKQFIKECSDGEKLDNALDEIIFADSKHKVLDWLK